MDFYMPPGRNGAEATEQARAILQTKGLNSHIVCLTAQKEGDFQYNKSMDIFDGFYEKPLGIEQVRDLIQKARVKNKKRYQ
jgi:CheY-like chemotaxis protein